MITTPGRIGLLAAVAVSFAVALTTAASPAQGQMAAGAAGTDTAAASAGAGKSSAPPARIGIGPIGPPSLPADLRIKLEDAAAAGLTASGASVVTAGELARARAAAGLGTCADLVCERRLAQSTDTRTWLRGTCLLDTSTYRLHLELIDAATGAVLAARDDTCDICTEADVADLANVAASALKTSLARSATPVSRAAPVPGVGAGAGDTAPPRDDKPRSEGATTPTWRRVLPWVAFAGAAAAITTGVYYLAADGDETDCMKTGKCQLLRDTRLFPALPYLGLGVALAATGVVVLSLPGPTAASENGAAAQSTARLIVSPGGIAVSGTF
ncbi:MAG: hypothetical protein ABUL77_03185 [Bacteroidota bacterium]